MLLCCPGSFPETQETYGSIWFGTVLKLSGYGFTGSVSTRSRTVSSSNQRARAPPARACARARWAAHGRFMGRPWAAHWRPMGGPWAAHGRLPLPGCGRAGITVMVRRLRSQ